MLGIAGRQGGRIFFYNSSSNSTNKPFLSLQHERYWNRQSIHHRSITLPNLGLYEVSLSPILFFFVFCLFFFWLFFVYLGFFGWGVYADRNSKLKHMFNVIAFKFCRYVTLVIKMCFKRNLFYYFSHDTTHISLTTC